jgi:4'-phosphopantetheinyl transferase
MTTVWIIARPPGKAADAIAEAASRLLPGHERARARSLAAAAARTEYSAFRVGLRLVLAAARPDLGPGMAFAHGPHGKPEIDGGPEFSFSATPGLALAAVSRSGPVGVDVERVRDMGDARAGLARAPGLARFRDPADEALGPDIAFLRAWTRLEAGLKREGRTLGSALGMLGPGPGRAGIAGGPAAAGCLRIDDLDIAHGFIAACAHGERAALTIRTFDWGDWPRQPDRRRDTGSD